MSKTLSLGFLLLSLLAPVLSTAASGPVFGRGSSLVVPGAGMTLQVVEDPAKNIYDNLQVAAVDKGGALGLFVKKTSAVTCSYNSTNPPDSGLFTYVCAVRLLENGELEQ